MKYLEKWYQEQVENQVLELNPTQLAILQQLDQFITKFDNQGFFSKLFSKPTKLGYYIYGDVGSGKTMIMNTMFELFPTQAKIRLHFHQFMSDIHQELASLIKVDNPLLVIAKKLKTQYKIIFLDEMHVSDIATAMILKNLFSSLFNEQIYLVTSSNFHPDLLYNDGLMRDRFLPAISLIKDKLDLIQLNTNYDYRSIHQSFNQLFFIAKDDSQIELDRIFNHIASGNITDNSNISILSRQISYIKNSQNVIWFDFDIICGEQRSQIDYLELIKRYEWFIISNLHILKSRDKDQARRLTLFIDILYDNRCKLALASTIILQELYVEGDFLEEFNRTLSRLREMQTQEYLAQKYIGNNYR